MTKYWNVSNIQLKEQTFCCNLFIIFQKGGQKDELTRTLAILVSVFIITQLPMVSYRIYDLFLTHEEKGHCRSYHYMAKIADILTVVNSSVNFLIYYPSAATFRKTVSNLFKRISFSSSRKVKDDRNVPDDEAAQDNLVQENIKWILIQVITQMKRVLKRLPWGIILELDSLLQKGSCFFLNDHV